MFLLYRATPASGRRQGDASTLFCQPGSTDRRQDPYFILYVLQRRHPLPRPSPRRGRDPIKNPPPWPRGRVKVGVNQNTIRSQQGEEPMTESHSGYYLPEPSHWPLIGSVGLFFLFAGLALALNGVGMGSLIMVVGFASVLIMVFGWFSTVIQESESGRYNSQVDKSFRWGMGWFIFSEVMFFAAFFGALFYARMYSVPWLGGEGAKVSTHTLLWPAFEAL